MLAEETVDATRPANFDTVNLPNSASITASPSDFEFVNLGPDNALWPSSSLVPAPLPSKPAVHDGAPPCELVAIIGTAVGFPGVLDAEGIWRVLEQGLNAVSEVCHSLILKSIVSSCFIRLVLQIPEPRFDLSAYNSGAHGAISSRPSLGTSSTTPTCSITSAFACRHARRSRGISSSSALAPARRVPRPQEHGVRPRCDEIFATYVGKATGDYMCRI